MNLPKVSIITVTYNAERYLERTLKSVLTQTYPNKEYILIDGNSKDATIGIIKKNAHHIDFWLSEPDKGIYDAMNKGLRQATGDYVIFINAGDTFYEDSTLEKIFNQNTDADIYYGEAQMIDSKTFQPVGLRSEFTPHQLPEKLTWQSMARGMVVCHQAILVKKTLIEDFDLSYQYSSDIDWVIRMLKKAQKIEHTHQIIATYLLGGVSAKKRKKSLAERYQILQKHFGFFPNLLNHFFIFLRGLALVLKRRKKYWD
jgi:glycosyltransferase involved in cell wall biosynthesis